LKSKNLDKNIINNFLDTNDLDSLKPILLDNPKKLKSTYSNTDPIDPVSKYVEGELNNKQTLLNHKETATTNFNFESEFD